jgi:hypothetical protein
MTLQEKILYHQIHPLKLAADIACAPVSLYLFGQYRLLLGIAAHFVPPVAASLVLIRHGELAAYKNSAAGAFMRRRMTRTAEGIRFAGDIVMVVGAWFREPPLIVLGLALVILACRAGSSASRRQTRTLPGSAPLVSRV